MALLALLALPCFCGCPIAFRLGYSPGTFERVLEAVKRPAPYAAPLSGLLPFGCSQSIPGQQLQYVIPGVLRRAARRLL